MKSNKLSKADVLRSQENYEKSRLPRYALSRSHLEAIGLVAAEWSALEDEVHRSIFLVSEVHYSKMTILTHGLGASALLGALTKFVAKSTKYKPMLSDCHIIVEKIIDPLRVQRNDIVHGVWYAVQGWVVGPKGGVIGIYLEIPKPTAHGNAKSRSGENKAIEFTPAQMRAVAKRIARARDLLSAMVRLKLTPSQRKFLESIRVASSKIHRSPEKPRVPHPPYRRKS